MNLWKALPSLRSLYTSSPPRRERAQPSGVVSKGLAAMFARRAGSLLFKRRMGGASEPFFSEGKQTGVNGNLFNETPPPPGQSRKWESWEAPWCDRLERSSAPTASGRDCITACAVVCACVVCFTWAATSGNVCHRSLPSSGSCSSNAKRDACPSLSICVQVRDSHRRDGDSRGWAEREAGDWH